MSLKQRDVTGMTFRHLTALRPEGRMYGKPAWLCQCVCGGEVVLPLTALTSGNTKSCGCLKRTVGNRTDRTSLIGHKFDRLTVVAWVGTTGVSQGSEWLCRCDCGNEVRVAGANLTSGNSKSCGCRKVDVARARSTTHGRSKSPNYKRWESIKQRTGNPNDPRYPDYGGRGIRMHPEWRDSFEAFDDAIGPPPPGLSLDRIDNDGNYEPGNVRWATRSQQSLNRGRLRDYR